MTDQTGKPPLSNPRAEAMAEDAAEAARVAAEAQAAPAEAEATPEPEPAPEPVPAAETAAETSPAEEDQKPRRSTEDVLKGRVGYLTKRANQAERIAAETSRQYEALKQLLEAQGATVPAEGAPAVTPATGNPPAGPRTYTEAEVMAEAQRIAAMNDFNAKANETYEFGKERFGDWDARLENLRATGLMTESLVDAAMSSDAPTDVLHHLGAHLDEAERIAALPPVRQGVELGKLASRLAAKPAVRISGASAPIVPVNGSVAPVVDLSRLADSGDMRAYAAQRAKDGSRWATSGRR